MSDAATYQRLQTILWRESRSLLRYVGDAFPWALGNQQDSLARLQEIIRAEQVPAAGFGRFLQKHHWPLPPLGSYPTSFTTINFVSLVYLLPQLVEQHQAAIRALEGDLAKITDHEVRGQVQHFLEMKRHHLRLFEEMQAKVSAIAS